LRHRFRAVSRRVLRAKKKSTIPRSFARPVRRAIAQAAPAAKMWTDVPAKGQNSAVLSWWKDFEADPTSNIPASFAIVRALFAIPASSAASERFFKSASFLEAGRPSLSVETLSIQVRIRDMLRQPEFNFDTLFKEIQKSAQLK
jgi:hypothetical protein